MRSAPDMEKQQQKKSDLKLNYLYTDIYMYKDNGKTKKLTN